MEPYGKRKCRILKEIRAEIARRNDIEWVVEECKHKGNCKGTCPHCEAEVAKLEKELARRQALGKAVAVVGVSAAMTIALSGCEDPALPNNPAQPTGKYIMNDPAAPDGIEDPVWMGEETAPMDREDGQSDADGGTDGTKDVEAPLPTMGVPARTLPDDGKEDDDDDEDGDGEPDVDGGEPPLQGRPAPEDPV